MAEVYVTHPPASGFKMPGEPEASDGHPFPINEHQTGPVSLNQTFVFPVQKNVSAPPLSCERGPTSFRPPSHRHKPSNLSLSTLPPFEFGSNTKGSPVKNHPSPTRSPVRLTPPSTHHTGHRRGGSEFVGGVITHGGPVLVSTSSSDDLAPPAPPSPAKGPPLSRRGHNHRRSHAISQSDVRSIMQPTKEPYVESDHSTPSESAFPIRPPMPQRSSSHPGPKANSDPNLPTSSSTANPAQAQARPRVGFSDSLEYVPRPLSTISSETSSSMSTIRAHHSMSDSVSSFTNVGASSPPSLRTLSVSEVTSSPESLNARALRFNNNAIPTVDSSIAALDDLPLTGSPPSSELPLTSKDINTAPAEGHSIETQHYQPSDDDLGNPSNLPQVIDCTQMQPILPSAPTQVRPRTSPESMMSTKQQRVKSWAETFLHRREKQASSPSQSAVDSTRDDTYNEHSKPEFSLDGITFDDDTTMIIEEPAVSNTNGSKPPRQSEKLCLSPDISQPSPMIDLDIAMTTMDIGTEDTNDYFGKMMPGKRKLHSSGETGGFTGPGMHYHRRAESAPEMEPFERSRFGLPRFGSNPAMEDAIAEEEEDAIAEEDEDASPNPKQEELQPLGLGVNVVEAEANTTEPIPRPSARSVRGDGRRVIRRIATPPNAFPLLDPVEIVEPEEEPRFSTITKSSDESSITPTVSPDPFMQRPISAPLDSALQTPSLTYGTTPETPSAVSSADYQKTSFDVREPRIHTARSSMTDRVTLNSSRTGDFSASSVDDVPSLTSSSSTAMSSFPNRSSGSGQMLASTERSASLSGAVPFRSRPGTSSKRASLASLSKLMGGPHNRSRLNIAETLPPDSPDKTEKKRHRISRMMKFWKSKEKLMPG